MNCSQQTNGAHVAATNMTTLLQKNCIKTLQMNNGVVVVGTAPVANTSMINANVVPITTTTIAPLTTNATAANLQTHTMIANASHIQPIQAFQYQQIQTVSTPTQPQYLIFNPSNGTVRPIVTNTTQPAAQTAIVSNAIYQTPHNFVTQNSLPKIGAITKNASTQQKVLNIVTSLKATPQQQQHQQQHHQIPNVSMISRPILSDKVIDTKPSNPNAINSNARQIVSIANGINNIVNTTNVTSNQIITSMNHAVHTAHTTTTNQHIVAHTAKTQIDETINIKNNNSQVSIQSTIKNESNIMETIQPMSKENAGSHTAKTESKGETIQNKQLQSIESTVQETNDNANANANSEENEPEPEIDIVINNVVCSFSVRCHLNLREIALSGRNVEYRRENGMVTMKLRRPYTTASIWSSGRITCTGATSEDQAKIGARRYARCLQALGFPVRFNNFRVVNVLGTCSMPWAINIIHFSERYKKDASYEPELHPGVTYKLKSPKATLKIFSTGSITVTAGSVADVQAAIEHIFPLVYEFRKKRTTAPTPPTESFDPDNEDELDNILGKFDGARRQRVGSSKSTFKRKAIKRKYPFGISENDPHDDNMTISDDDLDDDEIDGMDL